jgi:excisionase family DNA binding protein
MKQQDELLRRLSNIEKLLEERKTKPLNLVQAAQYLSISQSHLYKLTSQRKIPSHKPNGKYLYFYKDELDAWVRASSKEKDKSGKAKNEETQDVETEDEAEEEDVEPP